MRTNIRGGGGSGGTSLELTDGITDILAISKLTTTMLKVGGTSPSTATLKPNLTTVVSSLSSDVAMTTANTYYDGPTVSLTAGTWLIMGNVTALCAAALADFTAKLWDGTTAYNSSQATSGGAGFAVGLSVMGIVSPTGTTTYKVSVACGHASGTLKAATPNNGAGNNAASIFAVRVG